MFMDGMNRRVTIKITFIGHKKRETTRGQVDIWKLVRGQENMEDRHSCEISRCG